MLKESLDDEMKELVKEEISELEDSIEKEEQDLKILLLPKDPNDEKNVFMEVRAGTGGERDFSQKIFLECIECSQINKNGKQK